MLYIRSPDSSYSSYNWEFVPVDQYFSTSSHPRPLATMIRYCFYEFFFRLHKKVISHSIFLSVSGLSHLLYAFKIHPCGQKWQAFLLSHGLIIFKFGIVLLVYFCFSCLCFWCHNQRSTVKTNVKEFFPMFSSKSFTVSRFIFVFNSF